MVVRYPGDPGAPVIGVGRPAVRALIDPFPIGPAEECEVEVAPGKPADLAHDGRTLALARFDLIGEQDDLGDHGHFARAEGVVADGRERFVIEHAESLPQDGGGNRAVEQDGVCTVGISQGEAGLKREAELFDRGKGAEEVMTPGGEFNALRVQVPAAGEVEGLDQDALDMADEAFGACVEFGPDCSDLGSQVHS